MQHVTAFLLDILDDVVVGAAAGWLAGRIVQGKNPGLLASIIVGMLGGLVGWALLHRLGAGVFGVPPLVASFIAALVGSMVLWLSLRLVKRV
jgi:uncharacterized membrane protein YeaQ/YmgE (transglycosylase-associated protein family)